MKLTREQLKELQSKANRTDILERELQDSRSRFDTLNDRIQGLENNNKIELEQEPLIPRPKEEVKKDDHGWFCGCDECDDW